MGMWKLVIVNDGEIVTGEPLKQFLTEIGFDVPETDPCVVIPAPQRPAPFDYRTATKETFMAYKASYDAYVAEKIATDLLNAQYRAEYLAQFANFANVLSGMFTIATRVKVGGTWQLHIIPPKYTFLQAAQKLMGYTVTPPADPIEFIANNYF